VRFLGHVADPLERMRGWSVAVLPSMYPESAGLAVLEAMSLGVPVVATDHGGPPEVIGDAGLVVPPGDADALASAIHRLLDDEQLRTRCAEAGPKLVAAGLTLEHQQHDLLALLDDVAGHDRRALTWVVPDFVPGLGGTSRQTAVIGTTLSRRGHAVHVVTRRRTPELARREVVDGLAVTRVGLPGNGAVAEKLGLLSVALCLLRRRTGIVQILMYPDFALSAALAGRLPNTTMGWVGLGDATDALAPAPGWLRRVQRAVRRAALRRCINTVLIPSMERELTRVGLESELIPLPVDLDRFRPPTSVERDAARAALAIAPEELVVVYTGQLRRLKAVDRLIDAFAGFVGDDHSRRLIVVGGASGTADACEDELRDQVAAAGLDDRVTITGTVLDVRSYLWSADVFVLPSTREGMSYSLLEAMACGLACIAPVHPIGRDVLGDAGLVPPDNEPASLRACLVELANDPGERVRLGKAAAEAAQAWELERVVDRYESVFDRLHGRRS
jgi:glycosyltransferase involved in cell wall biosynthesis